MSRAHLRRPIQDSEGNLRLGAVVRVLQPGTTTLWETPIYAFGDGGTLKANPFTASDGVADFYLESPARVRLGISVGAEPEVFFDNEDVLEINPREVVFSHIGTPADGAASNPYYFAEAVTITAAWAVVGTAGSADSTVTLRIDGDVVATLTVASGQVVSGTLADPVSVPADSVLTVVADTVGTGVSGLTVQVEYT